jgi:TetR/AcrR family transcriptional regulator
MKKWGIDQPTREQLHQEKRAKIVAQAALFFSDSGYHGTTLADVASQLGVTKPALYYYFKDKQSLLYACTTSALERALEVFEALEVKQASDPLERIRRILLNYIMGVIEGNFQFSMFLELSALSHEHAQDIVALRDQFDERMRAEIALAIQSGHVQSHDPKMISFTLIGAVNWIAKWYKSEGPADLESVAQNVIDLAIGGIVSEPNIRSA